MDLRLRLPKLCNFDIQFCPADCGTFSEIYVSLIKCYIPFYKFIRTFEKKTVIIFVISIIVFIIEIFIIISTFNTIAD